MVWKRAFFADFRVVGQPMRLLNGHVQVLIVWGPMMEASVGIDGLGPQSC